MATKDFTTSFMVDKSATEVFDAITDVGGWWSEDVHGGTAKLNDEFDYRYRDVHIAKMKLIDVVPGKKIVWLVKDNYFNFTKDPHEWKGNKIVFEIADKDGKTELRFTQQGLTPDYECFGVCRDAWTNYINNSLKNLIMKGKGQPNPKEGGFNEQLLDDHKKKQA